MSGSPVGSAWGVACLGGGLRWGTLSLADVEVATRLSGPTVAAGSLGVRSGMAVALIGALIGESQLDDLRSASWVRRLAAGAAIVGLVAVFVAPGPSDPLTTRTLIWGGGAAAAAAVVLALTPLARRLPPALAIVLTAMGVVMASSAR